MDSALPTLRRGYDWCLRGLWFLWLCVSWAFSGAWAVAGVASALLGYAVPAYLKRNPQEAAFVNDLAWQIPLGVLGGLSTLRLLVSPFVVYDKRARADEKKILDLEERLRPKLEIDNRDQGAMVAHEDQLLTTIGVAVVNRTAVGLDDVRLSIAGMSPAGRAILGDGLRVFKRGDNSSPYVNIAPFGRQLFHVVAHVRESIDEHLPKGLNFILYADMSLASGNLSTLFVRQLGGIEIGAVLLLKAEAANSLPCETIVRFCVTSSGMFFLERVSTTPVPEAAP